MISRNENCVECRACVQKCPVKCISFTEFGKITIENQKCIHCNLCDSVCQLKKDVIFNKPGSVYAALWNDNLLREQSSSGGIAQVLYRNIINQGGIVFGAKFNKDLIPEVISASTFRDLESFKKSKYCFSNINNSFEECKMYCEEGKLVLYIGLPCQIAGLKLFLAKQYENLILVDILCHGAPHYSIFKNHIAYLSNRHGKKVIDYQFRNKKNDCYGPYNYEIHFEDDVCVTGSALWDAYYKSFLDATSFRRACYDCRYATTARISDITIGDFWNASNYFKELKNKKYISSLMINTQKGKKMIDICKNDLILYESNIDALANSTHAVCEPAHPIHPMIEDKLKNPTLYAKWARKYELSFNVLLRKIKFFLLKQYFAERT